MVEIFPQLTHKQLGDCQVGELVRKSWAGEHQHYVLIAEGTKMRFLVFLGTIGGAHPPGIMELKRPDLSAISYGNEYRIEIDQDAAHVDLTGNRLWDKSGALILVENHYVMRLDPVQQTSLFGSHYMRLDSCALVPEPSGFNAIFGKWSLMVPKGGERFETLCTIETG